MSAAYLAKAGKRVCVLEKRHVIGGAAVTEEIFPGFRYSRASYVFSLFRPHIIKDLELKRHGLTVYARNPSSFTPCLDGQSLLLGSDMEQNQREIAKFSKKDAAMFPKYNQMLEGLVDFFTPMLDEVKNQPLNTLCRQNIATNESIWGRFHLILKLPLIRRTEIGNNGLSPWLLWLNLDIVLHLLEKT